MKKYLILLCLFFSFSVFSYEQDPIFFLKNVLSEIKPVLIEKNDLYLEKIMDKYVDFEEIALWIVGRSMWSNSSVLDKVNFINELKVLMLKTYKNTVYYYIDADVDFLVPAIDQLNVPLKRIQIFSILRKNNKNINVSFRLVSNNASWFVFDIVIEGVSILKSLQVQYSNLVQARGLAYTTSVIKSRVE